MEIVCAQEEAKQNKPHIVYRNLSSTHAASKPIKADVIRLSNLLSQFLLGAVMKCSSPKMIEHLAACELPLYKGALCPCSLVVIYILSSQRFVEHGACL